LLQIIAIGQPALEIVLRVPFCYAEEPPSMGKRLLGRGESPRPVQHAPTKRVIVVAPHNKPGKAQLNADLQLNNL
jgi:hypothetical protein